MDTYMSLMVFSFSLSLCMERAAKKYVPSKWSLVSSISLGYLKVLWLLHGTRNFKPLISGQYHGHVMKQAAAPNRWVPCPCSAEMPLATSREPAMVKVPNTAVISFWYEMAKFSSLFFFLSLVPIAMVSSQELIHYSYTQLKLFSLGSLFTKLVH